MTEGPYYTVIEGTNIYEKTGVGKDTYQPNIFDTEETAQTHIDKSVEYRKRADLKPLERRVPITIEEYNRKYAKTIGIEED